MKKNLKLYGSFLWMGFNCLKATEPLRGGSLLFTTKFPEIPGTHLIDLKYERLSRPLGIQHLNQRVEDCIGKLDSEYNKFIMS